MRVEPQRRIGSGTEAVAWPVAQPVVSTVGKRFFYHECRSRNPAPFMKLCEMVMSRQRHIANPDTEAAFGEDGTVVDWLPLWVVSPLYLAKMR